MARFDVYTNPDSEERKFVPYFLDVQNECLDVMDTRVVIPLWSAHHFRKRVRDLNPELQIEQRAVILDTAAIGTIPTGELRRPVCNAGAQQLDIVNALDALFGSF